MTDPEFRQLPTPEPLALESTPSFLERLRIRRGLLAGLVAVGLVAALVSAVLIWRGGLGPTEPAFETPPSWEELAQQYPELAGLFADPTLGSVYKEFLVAYESGGLAAAEELAARRNLLNDRNEVRITLVVDDEQHVPAIVEELRGVGITVEGSYKEFINLGVPLSLIEQLAQQQGTEVLFQRLTQIEHIVRLELPTLRRPDAPLYVAGEGVAVTGAGDWHAAGRTGQSVRVGVLDTGFDGYRHLLGTELPESVVAASFVYGKEPDESGEVHGTACAEIVHEMAPDAELYLAYYDGTFVSMGQAVEWLFSQDVQIISNSTCNSVGPMDGSGVDAETADDAARRGVLWVNSAGNEADMHYRGQFKDTDGDGYHEFPDGSETMLIAPYEAEVTIILNWDDWTDLREDYDLYLYDANGLLLAAAEDIQDGTPGQMAAEGIRYDVLAGSVYGIAVKGHATTRSGVLDLYVIPAEMEFPVAEHSLCTPADAVGALGVGATEYDDDSLAFYSSQGPSNDGRLKPDLSAPAGVSSASYTPLRFDGTSASAPHVAGAAALVWSAFPEYSAAQVRQYLQDQALDLGAPGPDNGYGYGRLLLPAPPSGSTAGPVAPTPLPTLALVPTLVPQPSAVAAVVGLGETASREPGLASVSLWLVAAFGLCGAVVALGGGGLLALVLLRPAQRAARATPIAPLAGDGRRDRPDGWQAPHPVPSDVPDKVELGVLMGVGRSPLWLKPGSTSIGRAADNDLVLDSLLVSRHHARLVCDRGGCRVEDLGSANGLFVNHRRVSGAILAPGDRLHMGDVELTYENPAAVATQSRPWLQVGAQRYPLSSLGKTIGRSTDNDVHIADGRASRHHARIDWKQGAYVITDLGSTHGTYVNGQRVQQRALHDGDEITIGDTHLHFRGRAPGG